MSNNVVNGKKSFATFLLEQFLNNMRKYSKKRNIKLFYQIY